ncbi:MAG: GNAT family N-acetyltransferase [Candidatus Thiodiazotropha lotti]|uniref:GNAT family N-acetyltransferase n=1 Tax=Candidatus Thiodiazotropha endoloripes TaxID=1818881 RepID=UPI00083D83E9|nr:GNAT family N-acetyltransferase [Candidatus Thiodiazotropha endoloripes]MCG7897764.1 GNAT family N-acetyltransferase [Candidatus Thiodiazotropha weberae]MCG7992267.1 GNAT family N-acetyltransferase [Candidatus Thiodiazotropha lotti]MCG7904862.1 GNAT family N-acetyltransferase [Candidatus Thiodiazotropha weberae]MCG8001821.1 GNAT family N-acetyltransferase [Candidatus Thiodiazotropha lotti]MCW4183925.1 GNAT family N-acetyltransferase [Candidatus Thiodiazotropha weberae]
MKLFETERLYGREFTTQDIPRLTEILSDPEVMRYSVHGVCDETATAKFIDWCISCYADPGVGSWALIEKKSAELIGFCGVGPEPVDGVEQMNLGYRLAREYWNLGFATEAVNGVLDYVFKEKSLESVVAIIEPEHLASLRVAEKAGFIDYINRLFHGRPVRLYRLSSQEWCLLGSATRCL